MSRIVENDLIDGIELGGESLCIREGSSLDKVSQISRIVGCFSATVTILGQTTKRHVTPIRLNGVRYFADLITGTLYSTITGRCMSSSQLFLNPSSLIKVEPKRRVRVSSKTNHIVLIEEVVR